MKLKQIKFPDNVIPMANPCNETLGMYDSLCRLGMTSKEYDKLCAEIIELSEQRDSSTFNNIQDMLRC